MYVDLIERAWADNPDDRPSAKEILEALQALAREGNESVPWPRAQVGGGDSGDLKGGTGAPSAVIGGV